MCDFRNELCNFKGFESISSRSDFFFCILIFISLFKYSPCLLIDVVNFMQISFRLAFWIILWISLQEMFFNLSKMSSTSCVWCYIKKTQSAHKAMLQCSQKRFLVLEWHHFGFWEFSDRCFISQSSHISMLQMTQC